MTILTRFKVLLRGKKKAAKLIDSRPSEDVETTATTKDVTFFFYATSSSTEAVYLDVLYRAIHHPEVLSVRHSIKLGGMGDDFYARNNVCRVFEGTLRPVSSPPATEEIMPSTPFTEYPSIKDVLKLTASFHILAEGTESAPLTPLPDYPAIALTSESGEQLAVLHAPDTKCITPTDTSAAPIKPHRLYHSDFNEELYIGAGAWGFVHLARHRATGTRVAIKSVKKDKIKGKEDQLLREQATLRAVTGQKGVLDLLGSFQDDGYFYFVTRYYSGGDLLDLLQNLGCPPESLFVFYAAQLLLCLEKLHSRGIIHRDLKPANIFLDSAGNLILGDFGLAAFVSDLEGGKKEFCGTAEHLAREVWQDGKYGTASDVWAWAAVVFELKVGRRLWDANMCRSVKQMKTRALDGYLGQWLGNDEIPHDLMTLLEPIFEADADERPTLAQIKTHPFFASIDWEALANGDLLPPITLNNAEEAPEKDEFEIEDEPVYEDDDDLNEEEDAYPEFNFTSDVLIPVPRAVIASPVLPDLEPSLDSESSSADSSESESDDSSILLTPTLDALPPPVITSDPSCTLLSGAFAGTPLASHNSLASLSSYPDIPCPSTSVNEPSDAFVLPRGGAKRHAVILDTVPEIGEGMQAQIVRVFGDAAEVDFDAGWEHLPNSTSAEDMSRKRRRHGFVDRLKSLKRFSRSF